MREITLRLHPEQTTVKVDIHKIIEVRAEGRYAHGSKGDPGYQEFEVCTVHTRQGSFRAEGSASRLKLYVERLGGPKL